MMLRTLVSLVSVVGLSLVACGGSDADAVCDQQQTCAEKSGAKFSVTECKESNVKERERADTRGCSDEYSDAESCIGGLDFACEDFTGDGFARKSLAECGAKVEKLTKCLN